MSEPILTIRNVDVDYGNEPILRDISMDIHPGEIIGVVGESGSGKSTTIYATLGILGKGGRVSSGRILYNGRDLLNMKSDEIRGLRGSELSLIAQDPVASFHPIRKIRNELFELVKAHGSMTTKEAEDAMLKAMEAISLNDGKRILSHYAFELSGGMCQRTSIAMAMVLKPRILFADEPTSALDVTVQKQVCDEMMKIRDMSGTAIFMVSHNMGVISYMSDRIYVMLSGRVMESGSRDDIINHTAHPYTKKLISVIPRMNKPVPRGVSARQPDRKAAGCPFVNSCEICREECKRELPEPKEVSPGHFVRCCCV